MWDCCDQVALPNSVVIRVLVSLQKIFFGILTKALSLVRHRTRYQGLSIIIFTEVKQNEKMIVVVWVMNNGNSRENF